MTAAAIRSMLLGSPWLKDPTVSQTPSRNSTLKPTLYLSVEGLLRRVSRKLVERAISAMFSCKQNGFDRLLGANYKFFAMKLKQTAVLAALHIVVSLASNPEYFWRILRENMSKSATLNDRTHPANSCHVQRARSATGLPSAHGPVCYGAGVPDRHWHQSLVFRALLSCVDTVAIQCAGSGKHGLVCVDQEPGGSKNGTAHRGRFAVHLPDRFGRRKQHRATLVLRATAPAVLPDQPQRRRGHSAVLLPAGDRCFPVSRSARRFRSVQHRLQNTLFRHTHV